MSWRHVRPLSAGLPKCGPKLAIAGLVIAIMSLPVTVLADGTTALIVDNELTVDVKNVRVYLSTNALPIRQPQAISLGDLAAGQQVNKPLDDGHFYRWAQVEYNVNGRQVRSGACTIRRAPNQDSDQRRRYWLQVFIRIRTEDASSTQFQMDEFVERNLREEVSNEVSEEGAQSESESPSEDRASGRVVSINLRRPHVRRVRPGDFIELYMDYVVVPEQIVDDLETDIGSCSHITTIGVGDTGSGLAGMDRKSSLLYARTRGECTVTVLPIIAGKPQGAITLRLVVR